MKRRDRTLAVSTLGVLLSLAAASLTAQAPTPTPRAKPRLSGGFGRPRAVTPTPSAEALRPAGAPAAAAEKRARTGEKSGVSITNETLVTDPSKGKLTTTTRSPAPPAAADAAPSRTVASEVPLDGSAPGPAASEEEAKWRAAARGARERVETLKQRVAQLEGEEAKLQSDFYAWDDGQYRDGVIKPAWDRKREELEQARKELAAAEKELAELPEKARKAGALPGWLRE
jgi:hypothetical protein